MVNGNKENEKDDGNVRDPTLQDRRDKSTNRNLRWTASCPPVVLSTCFAPGSFRTQERQFVWIRHDPRVAKQFGDGELPPAPSRRYLATLKFHKYVHPSAQGRRCWLAGIDGLNSNR